MDRGDDEGTRVKGAVAFVAGATGYTGRAVVARLLQLGVRTVAHVRPDSGSIERWREEFEGLGAEVDTTAWQPEAMAATLERLAPTVVFALLGTTRKRGREAQLSGRGEETYETVDYGLTALLLHAAERVRSAPRFVYLSAVGVGPNAKGAYMRVRHRMETELRESGVPYTIARPSFITGADREGARPAERFGAAAADAALGVLGALGASRLRARYRSTSATELAHALVDAALDPACENRVLEPVDQVVTSG